MRRMVMSCQLWRPTVRKVWCAGVADALITYTHQVQNFCEEKSDSNSVNILQPTCRLFFEQALRMFKNRLYRCNKWGGGLSKTWRDDGTGDGAVKSRSTRLWADVQLSRRPGGMSRRGPSSPHNSRTIKTLDRPLSRRRPSRRSNYAIKQVLPRPCLRTVVNIEIRRQ